MLAYGCHRSRIGLVLCLGCTRKKIHSKDERIAQNRKWRRKLQFGDKSMSRQNARFGTFAPGRLDRFIIRLTSPLPDNWFGLRLAILLRRAVTMRLKYPDGALDVERWGMKVRLHPRDNGCEKIFFSPRECMSRSSLVNLTAIFTEQGMLIDPSSFSILERMLACSHCS